MKQRTLSKKDLKKLNLALQEAYGIEGFFDKKDAVFLVDDRMVVRDGVACVYYHDGVIVPTLKLILKQNFMKTITVDMGAVKHVVGGADIMRPGITHIDEGIAEDGLVVIIDEQHRKPLAIGKAMFSTEAMRAMDSGKVVKNIHYIGDDIWNFYE